MTTGKEDIQELLDVAAATIRKQAEVIVKYADIVAIENKSERNQAAISLHLDYLAFMLQYAKVSESGQLQLDI